MKDIFKISLIGIFGLLFLVSCEDDDDYDYPVEWDQTALSFEQNVVYEGGGDADVVYTATGTGVIYYAIVNDADVDAVPTAENLREEFGSASGPGFSGYLDGGSFTVNGELSETIDLDVYDGNSYTIYSTSANSYDYIGDLQVDNIDVSCESEISDEYNSLAYSEGVNISIEDGVVGNTSLTLIPGEENLYYARSLWGDSFVATITGDDSYIGQYLYPGIIQVNDDNTVTVLNTGNAEDEYAVGGTGTYDPCRNVFNLELDQGLFTGDFTVNVILSVD